jgi:acyl phosphate:glycerol-3-phosphate acyltransferase
MIILFAIVEFLCGSLMFSYWLGLAVNKDLKTVGDGNPGAFNLWYAAGFKLGILGVILDFMKGYLPLVILVEGRFIGGLAIIPVAIAPILGHAFSPFIKFKGGKGIAVTFGVWSAVTRFEVSIIYAAILAILLLLVKLLKKGKPISTEIDAFMTVVGMISLSIYLVVRAFPYYLIIFWFENLLLLTYTNKTKLHTLAATAFNKKNDRKNISS